ncbi:MAG TPA: YceI family protein [Polyangiaceae bacterium]|nr:YceI family protein [Polyangiaceae bacterium]
MKPSSIVAPSLLALISISLACVAGACNNDPAKGKTQATVTSAAAPVTGATPAAGAVNYAFSNDGSTIDFVGAKVSAKHEGSFKAFRGTISVVGGDPTKSTVNAEIDIASMAIEPAKLGGHLKSADFFDAEKFPKGKFTSTAVKGGGENGATHTVSGNLELHGVTKGITFPARVKVEAEQVSVDAEFAINRKDFAIVYPGMPDDLIKDDVLIKLALHAKKVP